VDVSCVAGEAAQAFGEARAAEEQQPSGGCVVPTGATQQVPDPYHPVGMLLSHDDVPFRLADGEQRGLLGTDANYCDVDFARQMVIRVVDRAGGYLSGQSAKHVRLTMMECPVPADLLEMRTEDLAGEPVLTGLPHSPCAAGPLDLIPDRPHDRVVEGDKRLGDPVRGSVVTEGIGFPDEQPRVLQYVDRVRDIGGLPG